MRQDEHIAGGVMSASGGTPALGRITIIKHGLAFIAKAPHVLIVTVRRDIVRNDVSESIHLVRSAGCATPLVGIAVPKQPCTTSAEPPIRLCRGRSGSVIRQMKNVTGRTMTATGSTSPYIFRSAVKEQRITLSAKTPEWLHVRSRRHWFSRDRSDRGRSENWKQQRRSHQGSSRDQKFATICFLHFCLSFPSPHSLSVCSALPGARFELSSS